VPAAKDTGRDESGGRLGAFIRRSGYVRKWLILGVAIGVIAGVGAAVFYQLLKYAGEFLLGYLGNTASLRPSGKTATIRRPVSTVHGLFRW
jgi:CIC family chloride channel protein